MREIISKEFLNEVLSFNFQNLRTYKIQRFCFPTDVIIAVEYENEDGWKHINIYELAHKCKEWAFDLGYKIRSFKHSKETYFVRVYKDDKEVYFKREHTQYEADINACKWIYENTKGKANEGI